MLNELAVFRADEICSGREMLLFHCAVRKNGQMLKTEANQ